MTQKFKHNDDNILDGHPKLRHATHFGSLPNSNANKSQSSEMLKLGILILWNRNLGSPYCIIQAPPPQMLK